MSVEEDPVIGDIPLMLGPETYEEEFQVEQILDKKTENGEVFYLIKWQGYEGQDTWEPERHLLDCPDLIKDYEDRVRGGEMGVEMEVGDLELNVQTGVSNGSIDVDRAISHVGFDRGLEPLKIIGATDMDGEFHFLMLWKGSDVPDLVPRLEANAKCPQVVIKFYEDKIKWKDGLPLEEMFEFGEEESEESETDL